MLHAKPCHSWLMTHHFVYILLLGKIAVDVETGGMDELYTFGNF